MTARNFLVMAGGTGGHVYPALGFAQLAREKGHRVSWLGTVAGLEARVVPANDIDFNTIDIAGVRGKGLKALIMAPFNIAKAVFQAQKIIKQTQPDLVIGFGGYSAGPGGVAAKLSGRPLVIHEQNAIAGTTNKLLSRIANKCLCAFERALPSAETVGNPVRTDILDLKQIQAPEQALDAEPVRSCRVLVIGGSLGARFLNESVPAAIASMAIQDRPVIRHQAGPKLLAEAQQAYKTAGVEAKVTAYIEDMAEAYEWADLVVCRAGAMTVSELSIAGVASLLVPFPFAIDDHQTANAQWLVEAGAARIYQQSENDLQRFTQCLIELVNDRALRQKMSENALSRGHRDATNRILSICETLISERDVAHVA